MYDLSLEQFKRTPKETSDDSRIRRAVEACGNGVLYIPKAFFEKQCFQGSYL